MAGKSGQYTCFNISDNVGLLLLCEVALGKTNVLYDSDIDADQLPKGKNSTHGIGTKIPDPKDSQKIDKDIVVPCGK